MITRVSPTQAMLDVESVGHVFQSHYWSVRDHGKTFRSIAATLRDGGTVDGWADGENGARTADRIAENFERQAEVLEELHEVMADAVSISITLEPTNN